jgi:hypothetical protein
MKHEIIYTNDYALIVSAEVIEKGDFCYDLYGDPGYKNYKFIVRCLRTAKDSYWNKHCKKIIAHRPLTDAIILEGVPLLPEFSKDDVDLIVKQEAEKLHDKGTHEDWDIYNQLIYEDSETIKIGYNKAKETYKYTEADLKKALLMKHNALSVDYVIDFLKKEKRPKYFDCETIYRVKSGTIQEHKDGLAGFEYYAPKTIINSEDWEELVGRYSYE